MISSALRARLPYLRDLGVDALGAPPGTVSPLADGGYDVADYRAIDPRVRHPRRRRGADRARPPSVSARSSTSSPTTCPTSTAGSRRHWPPGRDPLSGNASGSTRARRARRADRRTAGCRSSRAVRLDPDHRAGRDARRVVPAPVHPAPARPELVTPGGRDEFTGRPAVLVRPRRRRDPDRFGRPAGQGPRAARVPGRPGTGRTPARRSERAPRDLPVAGGGRGLLRRNRGSWSARSGCRTRQRFAQYLRPDELHTAFNFDFMSQALGRRRAPDIDREHARGALPGRRPGHLGAVQSRRHPTGHPLRPGRLVVRLRRQAVRHAHRPRSRSATRPGGRAAVAGSTRIRSTSTRATNSACPRSRTCRWTVLQDPMYFRSGGVDPGRDGCRVPIPWSGNAAPVRVQSPSRAAPPNLVAAAGGLGRSHRRAPVRRPRHRCCSCTATCWLGDAGARTRRRPVDLARLPPATSSRSAVGDRSAWSTSATEPVPLPPHAELVLTSDRSVDGLLPVDTAAWLRLPEAPADVPHSPVPSPTPAVTLSTRTPHSPMRPAPPPAPPTRRSDNAMTTRITALHRGGSLGARARRLQFEHRLRRIQLAAPTTSSAAPTSSAAAVAERLLGRRQLQPPRPRPTPSSESSSAARRPTQDRSRSPSPGCCPPPTTRPRSNSPSGSARSRRSTRTSRSRPRTTSG